jgi:hypothetical protein
MALPKLRQPTVFWVLTQTYKQQVESTQSWIEKWIGTWPHKIRYAAGSPEAAQLILVKPINGSNNPKSWSRIWFHVQATGESLPGGRLDGVWGDEPPDIQCWEEATARGRGPGFPFFLWITYTPIKRLAWEPLKNRFEGTLNNLTQGRIRLHATIYDNPWFDQDYIDKLKDLWRGQWDFDARLMGAEVDDTGMCPFMQSDALRSGMSKWQSRVKAPELVEVPLLSIPNEATGAVQSLRGTFERYAASDPEERYIGFVDPSLGTPSPDHDPGGFHQYARVRPRLVDRFHGYLEPYALGYLAGKAMRFPDDPLYIEMNDNLGIQVVRGAKAAGHKNFGVEFREDKLSGKIEEVLGWKTTTANRGGMFASVQQMLLEDSVIIESQGLLDGLRGVTVNAKGRIAAQGRKHDEDAILLGRFGIESSILGAAPRTQRMDSERQKLLERFGYKPQPAGNVGDDSWWRGE